MRKVPTAREIMTPRVLVLHADADIYEAIDLLVEKREQVAAVVDGKRNLVGLFTEKDALRVVSNAAFDCYDAVAGGKVAEYMSPITASLSPALDLFTVASRFLTTNFTHLPVLDRGVLAGLVSRHDTLKGIRELQRHNLADLVHDKERDRMLSDPRSIEQMLTLVGSQKKELLADVFHRRHGETCPPHPADRK